MPGAILPLARGSRRLPLARAAPEMQRGKGTCPQAPRGEGGGHGRTGSPGMELHGAVLTGQGGREQGSCVLLRSQKRRLGLQ